jgi:hypothetical protein
MEHTRRLIKKGEKGFKSLSFLFPSNESPWWKYCQQMEKFSAGYFVGIIFWYSRTERIKGKYYEDG